MTVSTFKQSLSLVLAHEGGYVNNAKDPGGPTNQGITQHVYDAYHKVAGVPVQSVKLISAIETADIYKKQYWNLVSGDRLPTGLDYAVFDFGVNSGISRALKYLQMTVGVAADAVIGNETMTAIYAAAKANENALILKYCANRMAFLKSLGTFPTFGKGWTRRVVGYTDGAQDDDNGVLDFAIMMANNDPAFVMPAEIGSKPGEVAAKAVAEETPESFVQATPDDIKALAAMNDRLASLILAS